MERKRELRLLILILCIFTLLSAVYSIATRLKCGPDEPAHFIYIRSIAEKFAPPEIAHTETHDEDSASSHEGHQPPLYYALMAMPYAVLKAFGISIDIIWRILRLLGIPIGVAWIYSVYLLTRRIFQNAGYALAVSAFTALIPTSGYMSGVLSNDVLVALFFTIALTGILDYFQAGSINPRKSAILGLWMGLAILTKAQALILPLVFLVIALLVLRRKGYKKPLETLRDIVITLGITAVVCGWWFVRCMLIYGYPMPHSLFHPIMNGSPVMLIFIPLTWNFAYLFTMELYTFFWAPFWLVRPFVSDLRSCFEPILALTIIAFIGLILRLRKNKTIDRKPLRLIAFVTFLIYAVYMHYMLFVDSMSKQQGRLLLPVASAIAIFFVLGFDGFLKSAKAKTIGAITGLGLMLIANIVVIGCVIAYYA